MKQRMFRWLVVVAVFVAVVALPATQAAAGARREFGVAVPFSTSFSFGSLTFALEAYGRLLGAAWFWESALRAPLTFGSLYVRNTVGTTTPLHLTFGHVTNLLPHFGSTYVTAGLGLTFGRLVVVRLGAGVAVSVSFTGFYPFLEFRIQFGFDP
ncbi:MAG: hypothetical protein JSW65_05520 [Candidatus Bipolaricaulota bacterium]|nr:MAG: hypothetical protein JSW65_05520 [Candidatus Bipolaricaulota bacterium]